MFKRSIKGVEMKAKMEKIQNLADIRKKDLFPTYAP